MFEDWMADTEARLVDIQIKAGDDAAAHGAEDRLYIETLKRIASGALRASDAARLASEALKAMKIQFARWNG